MQKAQKAPVVSSEDVEIAIGCYLFGDWDERDQLFGLRAHRIEVQKAVGRRLGTVGSIDMVNLRRLTSV